MASEKKRRSLRSTAVKSPAPAKPKDGDRRHRGVNLARLEQERPSAWNLDVGWTMSRRSRTGSSALT